MPNSATRTPHIPTEAYGPLRDLDLQIEGMTCASCVGRIERKLKKIDGVEPAVNLALESASVKVPADVSNQQIVDTIKSAGYGATITGGASESGSADAAPQTVEDTRNLSLDISGMTCASCVGRIERKLKKLPGVEPSVNLALESASVKVPAHVSNQQIVQTVQDAGYGATITADDAAPISPPRGTSRGGEGKGEPTASESGKPGDPTLDMSPAQKRMADLKKRLIVAAVLSAPVFVISMIPGAQFPHWGWVVAILTLPVVTWAAWPFHKSTAINARHLATTMDTLVSMGITAAYLFSLWHLVMEPDMTAHAQLGQSMDMAGHQLYFESAAIITTFLLLGRWLEARAKSRSGEALQALLNLGAQEATLISHDGTETTIAASDLQLGDRFVVRPGEKVATDSIVISGESAVDESMLTGESMPVDVSEGSELTGATVNTTGRLIAEATRVGSDTVLASMGRTVARAQATKAPIARLADRISAVFVPVVIGLALLTLVLWLVITGDLDQAFVAAVSVLVIACPCALGLATPTAMLTGSGRGSQLGILITSAEVLEDTRDVDTVIMDKTGTVTRGELSVQGVKTVGSMTETNLLDLAAAVEHHSEHPIAQAIAAASEQRLPVSRFQSAPGGGVKGYISDGMNARAVVVGRESWLAENDVNLTDAHLSTLEASRAEGYTTILVAVDGSLAGFVNLSDTVKDESAEAIASLRELGLRPVLLTGDNVTVARSVAAQVGIAPEDVIADVTPDGKVQAVAELQQKGHVVAMVGDGVNDAPALTQADLGIAMGSGTDAAMQAADITVVRSELTSVPLAIKLSLATLRTIKSNLFWAFAYNVVAIPVAAFGLLNPMIAGAAMAFSSVFVVLNSLRLKGFARGKETAQR